MARTALRVLAIVGGGYAASAAWVAAGSLLLAQMGVARSDAYTLCGLLGFLVYLSLALWAAAERRLGVLCLTLLLATAAGASIAALVA